MLNMKLVRTWEQALNLNLNYLYEFTNSGIVKVGVISLPVRYEGELTLSLGMID